MAGCPFHLGRGPQLTSLRDMVRKNKLGEMVSFTGRVSERELLAILSTADVCLNPDNPTLCTWFALGEKVTNCAGVQVSILSANCPPVQ